MQLESLDADRHPKDRIRTAGRSKECITLRPAETQVADRLGRHLDAAEILALGTQHRDLAAAEIGHPESPLRIESAAVAACLERVEQLRLAQRLVAGRHLITQDRS